MKKTKIFDFFKHQPEHFKVPCPACGISVFQSQLNKHLDNKCSSSLKSENSDAVNSSEISTPKKTVNNKISSKKWTSNKLSLKHQRAQNKQAISKKTFFSNKESDDEIIIVEEHLVASKDEKKNSICSTSSSNFQNQSQELQPSTCEDSMDVKCIPKKRNTAIFLDSENCTPKNSSKPKFDEIDSNTESEKHSVTKFCTNNSKVSIKRKFSELVSGNAVEELGTSCSSEQKRELDTQSQTIENQNSENIIANSNSIDSVNEQELSSLNFETANDNSLENSIHPDPLKQILRTNDKLHSLENDNSETLKLNKILPIERLKSVDSKSDSLSGSFFNDSDLRAATQMVETDDVFSELSDSNEKDKNQTDTKTYTPYYIANFKHILKTVLNEKENEVLFNNEDKIFIASFENASDAAQKLYVRLFQRKYKWLRLSKINYPEITKDPSSTLKELAKAGLVDTVTRDIELETALELLSLPEAKTLAKHFNFNSGKNKSDIKQMILKHCKEHKSVFFMNKNGGISSKILAKVIQILGSCFRISLLPKRLFTRILMLFSLPVLSEDDDDAAGGMQQQLLTLLQINKGELVFPEYKRTREAVIFCDRDELIRYEEARQLENDILNAVENKNFELAKELYITAKDEFEDQCGSNFAERSASLPSFLKRYTSFHVYIRCMTQGVEALQKLRQYKEAVSLLRRLLKQKVYCQDYKGRWYDRLALNLEQHLKKPDQALAAIKSALQDKNVRVGHRYALLTRGLRITKSFDENDEVRKQLLHEANVTEAPKITIKGRLCPRPILGRRNVFISSSTSALDEEVTILGVEQLAIEHYKEEGFIEGVHGEGSTFISLYALLFWDIIYDGNIPDVFISPYQTHPMDLNSESFYESREEAILKQLIALRASSNEELKEIVKTTWESHYGKASLMSWERFTDLEHVQGLVCCMGSHILSGICERIAKDFRFTRSGVPDLVVWNPDTLQVKIVEVKGPGDKLSSKQILWLDYLIQLGADAEVCLVEAVASKKLKKENL